MFCAGTGASPAAPARRARAWNIASVRAGAAALPSRRSTRRAPRRRRASAARASTLAGRAARTIRARASPGDLIHPGRFGEYRHDRYDEGGTAMSVIMVLTLNGDGSKVEEFAAA